MNAAHRRIGALRSHHEEFALGERGRHRRFRLHQRVSRLARGRPPCAIRATRISTTLCASQRKRVNSIRAYDGPNMTASARALPGKQPGTPHRHYRIRPASQLYILNWNYRHPGKLASMPGGRRIDAAPRSVSATWFAPAAPPTQLAAVVAGH